MSDLCIIGFIDFYEVLINLISKIFIIYNFYGNYFYWLVKVCSISECDFFTNWIGKLVKV